MKKLLSLLLTFMLLFSIASCGASGGDTEGDGGGVSDEGSGDGTDIPDGGSVDGGEDTKEDEPPTEIIIEFSENTILKSLIPTARKLCGGIEDGSDVIDRAVKERNDLAAREAGVTVKYKYVPDDPDYNNMFNDIRRIRTEAQTYAPGSTDIYNNFTLFIHEILFSGVFANLKSKSSDGEALFRFCEEDYDKEAPYSEGYYYGYMSSVSLTDDRLYVIASDYDLDFARRLFSVPTNINLLSGACAKLSEGSDVDAIEEITELVLSGGWTFEALARYANAAYVEKLETNSASFSEHGEVLGFAARFSLNPDLAHALFTSSDVKLINKGRDEESGEYFISYPENNDTVLEIFHALEDFYNADGITDVDVYIDRIADEFRADRILFGGIDTFERISSGLYSDADTKLIPLPVPIYKKADGIGYNSSLDSLAKVFAIAVKTDALEKCAAFLDYQATHSSDIADSYLYAEFGYDGDDALSVAGRRMIDLIKTNIKNSFEVTISNHSDFGPHQVPDGEVVDWFTYIRVRNYDFSNIDEKLPLQSKEMQNSLDGILRYWDYIDAYHDYINRSRLSE